ncbi:vWA domain-containing protein [Bacillus sp. DX1.1]|uniref:vWA domain-containing protein n=1 Tax=unclassified Bacillus (in: firmicutes) TaxID=185979 RepID=UPI002570CC1E|nr:MULTISPECIES: vWA domain-containing protein [unclassified Bacillus (in: firmicutes)]MDM5154691.1 vWA domain-containing protein [Bacillus sp. DX1.1]WJE83580.1 vWA domain-containing protein [Bacillus sp. DX3.1]
MLYQTQATQQTPAYIIYLLDVSASMNQMMDAGGEEKRRIDIVTDALSLAIRQMVFRSTKGSRLLPRYRLSILAYSDHVFDLLGGVKTIDEVARLRPLEKIQTHRLTDTAKAFSVVEKLLQNELPNLQDGPAPVVCHMTDGASTGEDPEPIVQRIMNMSVPDGNVLVENIFISDEIMQEPISNIKQWKGIMADTNISDEYGAKLQRLSSPIPQSYREMMIEHGFHIADGAIMMFPGTNADLVSLGFQMSAATPVR